MAVLTASKPVTAIVAHVDNVAKQGNYGPYYSTLFESPDLEGGRIWRSLPPDQAAKLTKGMTVQLQKTHRNGKETWDIIIPETETPKTIVNPAQSSTLTPDRKREIAAYIEEMGGLYAFCYTQAGEKLTDAPDAAKQAMASSLFIAVQRKFNLT